MKLTDLALKNLNFDGTQRRIFDDSLPNFGIRTYKSGISFIVLQGATRKSTTIGKYPAMSLKQARTEALHILGADITETSSIRTTDALSEYFLHCETKNKPRTIKDYKRLLNKHLPKGKLSSLTKLALIKKLNTLRHIPAERSHATTAFQVFFNWCVHNGYLETNPIAGLRNQGKIRTRERILSNEEVKSILQSLGDDRFHRIVRILILTGLRRGEVQHIIVNDDIATIPAEFTKNGREHTFPLGPLSKQYVEPITFNGWGKSKKRLDDNCGVTDWTLHDFRRYYASTHAQLGTPIHVVEKLLNHVSGTFGGIVGVYQKFQYQDEMREACIRYEEHIRSLCSG